MTRRFSRWASLLLAALALGASSLAVFAGVAAGARVADLQQVVVVVAAAAVGALVARARPRLPIGWLLLVAGLGLAVADAGAWTARAGVSGGPWFAWVSAWSRPTAFMVLLLVVPLHFPDGLPAERRWRVVHRAVLVLLALSAVYGAVRPGPVQVAEVANPLGVPALTAITAVADEVQLVAFLAALAAAVVSVVGRYRRADRAGRAQIKWLAYAVAMWLVLVLLSFPAEAMHPGLAELVEIGLVGAGAGLPVAVGIAVLRHGLYDVDLVISRTLVYAALTVAVVALYVVTVGYLGMVLQTGRNLAVSLVATGVVAVAFNPLRVRLQRAVNRLVYGDRDDPYAALSRLERRLDEAASPQALLELAVAEVAAALKLSYVAVEVDTPTGGQVAAVHGPAPARGSRLRIPLKGQGATVGWLVAGVRNGEQLPTGERRLLEALARPIGATLHAHQLAADLQASRERLVAAREEERGRLHRDLHDGLGPELATLSMLGEAARDVLRADPDRAEALLDDLVERAQHAVGDLRRVVYALRPAALDVLGLVGALHAFAATQNQHGLEVEIDVESDPRLPPAVEVAAYRIAVEAITNVTRHARARHCTLRLAATPSMLQLEVTDDGHGITPDDTPGVGLSSMRDRARELGGDCTVAPRAGGGTTVTARLPLSAPHDTHSQRPIAAAEA
ncbi:MAG TPA: sensor histidine kinase [Egibacteraceae bacterium]|jgi:signal transduction histidine kinase|nr:sensor histidine kinase [Egibacteraceae bacterium]